MKLEVVETPTRLEVVAEGVERLEVTTGPRGPKGDPGPPGPIGDPELIHQAIVDYLNENPLEGVTPTQLADAITTHRNDPEPHPAYDIDMPSLTVLFENGLI